MRMDASRSHENWYETMRLMISCVETEEDGRLDQRMVRLFSRTKMSWLPS